MYITYLILLDFHFFFNEDHAYWLMRSVLHIK